MAKWAMQTIIISALSAWRTVFRLGLEAHGSLSQRLACEWVCFLFVLLGEFHSFYKNSINVSRASESS